MINTKDFKDIEPKPLSGVTAQHVSVGLPIPKVSRLEQFSADDLEGFIEEWASSLKTKYASVKRFSGAGDRGIDIAAFSTNSQFSGGWHNYQCKQYNHALHPSDIWIELGKVLYFTYLQDYPPPEAYYFVAPKGIGTSLSKLLSNATTLKAELKSNWDQHCRTKITKTNPDIKLDGPFLAYFDSFDFTIFNGVPPVTLIEQHSKTPFHSVRFGGGLPPRTTAAGPPAEIHSNESRYLQQLFSVYSELKKKTFDTAESLKSDSDLEKDFLRQRERFYSAEALRNFARDNVPSGTFDALQKETLHAVIDTCEDPSHKDGMTRMRATLNQATFISFASNPLFTVINTLDKQGICHQLANEDGLVWLQK